MRASGGSVLLNPRWITPGRSDGASIAHRPPLHNKSFAHSNCRKYKVQTTDGQSAALTPKGRDRHGVFITNDGDLISNDQVARARPKCGCSRAPAKGECRRYYAGSSAGSVVSVGGQNHPLLNHPPFETKRRPVSRRRLVAHCGGERTQSEPTTCDSGPVSYASDHLHQVYRLTNNWLPEFTDAPAGRTGCPWAANWSRYC